MQRQAHHHEAVFITLAVFLSFCMTVSAVDQAKLDEFASGLGAAFKTKDIHALNQFICSKDATREDIGEFIDILKKDLQKYTFDEVTFYPLDDPRLNPKPTVERVTIHGHHYGPNLKPVIVCIVALKSEHGSFSDNRYLLGLAPDGSLKIVVWVLQK